VLNIIKQALFSVVGVASTVPIQGVQLDRLAAKAAIAAIKLYRLFLSPLVGRDCLFHPTCSCFAESALRMDGWTIGSQKAYRRLLDCAGGYSLFLGADGNVRMRTRSGEIVEGIGLSQAMIHKTRQIEDMARKQSGAPLHG
jgi:putative membrane protein insertion efficiency factor